MLKKIITWFVKRPNRNDIKCPKLIVKDRKDNKQWQLQFQNFIPGNKQVTKLTITKLY